MRLTISSLFSKAELPSPFSLAPALNFNTSSLFEGGSVEYCNILNGQSIQITSEILFTMGAVIGLCVWFGLSDLHFENFLIGRSSNAEQIFFPIDIETIFEEIQLPSQTSLLSNPYSLNGINNKAGLYRLKKILQHEGSNKNLPAFLSGYFTCFNILDKATHEIFNSLPTRDELLKIPIRVIVRSTRTYLSLLKNNAEELSKPLINAETEQLARGDVPYFFRFLNSNEVFYFSSKHCDIAHAQLKLDSSYFEVPPPRLIIKDTSDLQPSADIQNNRKKAGVLQLARYFNSPDEVGIFRDKNTTLVLEPEKIIFQYKTEIPIHSKRRPPDEKSYD